MVVQVADIVVIAMPINPVTVEIPTAPQAGIADMIPQQQTKIVGLADRQVKLALKLVAQQQV